MSLQVWLPLTEDAENYGVNSAKTSSTATFENGGKTGGKCMTSGTITIPASNAGQFLNNNSFSYACWIYVQPSATGSGSNFFGTDSMGANNNRKFSLYQYPNPVDLHWSWQNDTANAVYASGVLSNFFTSGGWTHLTVTYQNPDIKIYKNGQLYHSATGVSNSSSFAYTLNVAIGNSTHRKLNDVRIYDHCLSEKEVKELAKGLVLHYRLAGPGQENLTKGNNTYERNSVSTDGWFWFSDSNFNCKPSTTYTLSIDIDGTISNFHGGNASTDPSKRWASMWLYICKTGTSTNAAGGGYDLPINLNSTNYNFRKIGPTRYAWTYTTPADARSLSIRGNTYSNGTNAIKVKFWNPKIEEGTIATPWCPRSDESIYTSLGYNNNIEYDCSGYRRNGTKSGSIAWDVDSPRYTTSYRFQKPSGIFCQPNLAFSQFTIAFWGKHTETNKMLMGSNGSLTDLNSDWYWYGDNSFKYPGGEYYYSHNAGPVKVNEWCHYAAVYDGTKIQIYRNGINEGNQAKTGILSLNKLSVGNGYPDAYYWENGNVADFRIYTTALSAEDIAELYHSAVIVDNTGKSYAYEYFET